MKNLFGCALCAVAFLSLPLAGSGQSIVPIGNGSIASMPPAYKAKTEPGGPGFNATMMLSRKIYADELPARQEGALSLPGRPIPTNDWWTDIINNQFSGALWSYPAMLKTSEEGVQVFYPSYWADAGKEMKSRSNLSVGAKGFRASAAVAKDWHDWDVVFRMPGVKNDGEITVTSAHGSPFTWFEFSGLAPEVAFSDGASLFSSADGFTGVKVGSDLYGLYYPVGAAPEFTPEGTLLLAEGTEWMVVALLRSESDLNYFARYATSIPRDTRVEWSYNEPTAAVESRWMVSAENLRDKGAAAPVVQGFLPHLYKYTLPASSVNYAAGSFRTPRGELKLAVAESGSFSYAYRFSGMLPSFGAPAEGNAATNGFRREVLDKLMSDYAAHGSFGADTYWGGKGLVQMAQNMSFAKQTGNMELYESSKRSLRDAFENWLTYTPGEDNYFFSYYPRWGAMLGFDVSYDSDAFNDHHFHYGYFTYAAALLCMEDKDFAARYGEILTMIAKDYANWDRDDTRFPFLRTLDPWCGHSWAGGLGDHGNDNGNGQESTSEAMQSWGGIYLLGVALDNKEMRDAGIWGWSTEARATREYWYDVDAPRPANAGGRKPWAGKGAGEGNYNYDEYPYAYNSNITGKGIGWWTWFGGDPLFMHGIQWMPISPALDYLSWDPDFVGWAFDDMMSGANSTFSHDWFEPTVNSDGSNQPIEPLAASDWGNVALAYLQRHDPQEAARVFDEALERGMHIATAVSTAHISYYITHSHLTYGDPDFSCYADLPTSQVYVKNGVRTYFVYNPSEADRTVNFYGPGGALIKTVTAPAGKMVGISADPAATSIECSVEGGNIIPPGESAAVAARVLDQYGAGLLSEKVEMSLSAGAPASIVGNTLKINADAARGSEFTLIFASGALEERVKIMVNDRPEPSTASVRGVPEICERGTRIEASLQMIDQYGAASEPKDVSWTLVAADGAASKLAMPATLDKAGRYTLRGHSASTGADASVEVFVTPELPLLSLHANAVASSAENGGSLPAGATDGDLSVRWGSAHTDDEWLVVDLGAENYISRVSILWEAAYASSYLLQVAPADAPLQEVTVNYAGNATKVRVPIEDAWTTAVSESATSAGEKTSVVNASGRYVRMKGVKRASVYGYSCYEMNVYGLSGSLADDDIIGVDFDLPPVMDSGSTLPLHPRAYTRGGSVNEAVDLEWSADKEAEFSGNNFTPKSHGNYTVVATLPGVGSFSSSLFVNETERPAAIKLESDNYVVVEGEDLEIPFVVMNQFMAPYSGNIESVAVTIKDEQGNETSDASYSSATHLFRSDVRGTYTVSFSDMAACTVRVKALSEVNLATGKNATASSSNGDNNPRLAVDGNTDTRWESRFEDNQTLTVDLEEIYLVDRVNIIWEGAYAKAYTLQASADGENWFDFYEENASQGGDEKLTLNAAVPTRYIRLFCRERALSAYGFSVRELEVYGRAKVSAETATAPKITCFDAAPLNGALEVAASAEHPSGAVFLSFRVSDENGNILYTSGSMIASGQTILKNFGPLSRGEYTVALEASDAFGNKAQESTTIHVDYSVVGINLALGKRAWATSRENDALGAEKAVDGSLDTRWGSTFNDEESITVDLGDAYPLTEIVIHWNQPAYATDYSVALSTQEDEASFASAAERHGYVHDGTPVHILLPDAATTRANFAADHVMARYVRIVGHKRATQYGTSINEIEVYGKDIITGITSIDAETDGAESWYTLQGRRISRPHEPGIYIRVVGGKASKVLLAR